MFDSRSSFSREGPLAAVWMAAYLLKKLKKAQVFDTHIPSSIDRILQNEPDAVAYRVLAYFLIGIVRIYCKKVEYLFDDCQDVMFRIKDFVVGEKSNSKLETRRVPYSTITVPDRFELDAFDLGILEDVSRDNVVPQEEITLKDFASKAGGIGLYSLAKYHCEELSAWHDIGSIDYLPTEDIFSSHLMENDMNVSTPHDFSNLEASLEKLLGSSFLQEESTNLGTFCGIYGEAADPIKPFGGGHKMDGEHIKAPAISETENEVQGKASSQMLQEDWFQGVGQETLDLVNLHGEDHQSDGEQKVPSLAKLENEMCQDINEDNNLINLENEVQGKASTEMLQDDRFHGLREETLGLVNLDGEEHQSDREQMKVPSLGQLANEVCQHMKDDNNLSNLEAIMEKLRDHRCPQEVCMDAGIFARSQKEPPELTKQFAQEHHTDEEQLKSEDMSGNRKCLLRTGEHPVSVTLDMTPQSKFPDASGHTSPGFMVVHTPNTKEPARVLGKRKCCYDDVTVFPNDVIRRCIEDASDLVSKRRRVPHTALTAWKAFWIPNLSRGFLLPLLPCISSELKSLFCQERLKIPENSDIVGSLEPESPTACRLLEQVAIAPKTHTEGSFKQMSINPETPISKSSEQMGIAAETPTGKSSEQIGVPPEAPSGRSSEQISIAPETPAGRSSEQMDIAPETPTGRSSEQIIIAPETPTGSSSEQSGIAPETPTGRSSEQMAIAPETPTDRSSERMAIAPETPIFDLMTTGPFEAPESYKTSHSETVRPTHFFEIVKKEPTKSKDQEFDLILMNEETNSFEAENREPYELYERTRKVARCLHRRFLYQKNRGENEEVNLLQLLEGKIKKESAMLFYEMLVLKTKGFVDVRQDEAYGDILVQKVPHWDQI